MEIIEKVETEDFKLHQAEKKKAKLIIEINTRIAKFMGYKAQWEDLNGNPVREPYLWRMEKWARISELPYHLSWDTIMPVVNKINTENYGVLNIYQGACKIISTTKIKGEDIHITNTSTIKAVWYAINELLIRRENQRK